MKELAVLRAFSCYHKEFSTNSKWTIKELNTLSDVIVCFHGIIFLSLNFFDVVSDLFRDMFVLELKETSLYFLSLFSFDSIVIIKRFSETRCVSRHYSFWAIFVWLNALIAQKPSALRWNGAVLTRLDLHLASLLEINLSINTSLIVVNIISLVPVT